MILYIENPKDSTKKLLELKNEFSIVPTYKINIQKFVAFLYTNSDLSERETKKAILFTIASPPHPPKYPGISLTKGVKELYMVNYKSLKKDIEEHINRWKHISCTCPYYPKQSIDSKQFLSRFQ